MSDPTPSPTQSSTLTAPSAGPTYAPAPDIGVAGAWLPVIAAVFAALIAAAVALYGAHLQRKTGKGMVEQAKRSADAASRASEASETSANAARKSAEISERTAALNAADSKNRRQKEAAEQRGSDKVAIRDVGIQSLVQLADEWPENRQDCIDSLCFYLQTAPFKDASGEDDRADTNLRRFLFTRISDHLRPNAETSWSEKQFNFRGAVVSFMKLFGCTFRSDPDFRQIVFKDPPTYFEQVTFESGARFDASHFFGTLELQDIVAKGTVSLDKAVIEQEGNLLITRGVIAPSAAIRCHELVVRGILRIEVPSMPNPHGEIRLSGVIVEAGGSVEIFPTPNAIKLQLESQPSSPVLVAEHWTVHKGSNVRVDRVLIDAGLVRWDNLEVTET